MISQSRLLIKQRYSYAQLIQLLPSGQLKICKQGQTILSNAILDQLIIISIQGEPTNLFQKFINQESNLRPDPSMLDSSNSSVWITTLPYEHPNQKKKIYFLQTVLKRKQDVGKLHTLCSTISSVILLNIHKQSKIDFLQTLKGKIIVSKQKQTLSIRDYIGSILVIYRQNNDHEQLESKNNQFHEMIIAQNVQQFVQNTYYFTDAFAFANDQKIKAQHYPMLKKIIRSIHQNIRKKIVDQVMFGPVLKQYLTQIVQQFNQKGMVQLQKCIANIEIDQGYDTFNQVYRDYHDNLKNVIGDNENKPIPQLQPDLEQIRMLAYEQYDCKCSDPFYRLKLQEALGKKQKQALAINNQLYRSYNAEILEKQANKLQAGIEQNKYDNKKIKQQVENMVERYKDQAGGDSKYQILSEFLNKFVPMLMKNQDSSKNQQTKLKIQTIRKQNKQMQKRLTELEKKRKQNSGCC